jgi:phage FluMu protein Com
MPNSKEYNKNYYENTKAKNKGKVLEKVRCEMCDLCVSRSNLSAHIKSKKHRGKMVEEYTWLDRMKDKEVFASSIDALLADMQKLKAAYDEVKN